MTLTRLRNGLLLLEVVLIALFAYGYYSYPVEWRLNGTIIWGEIADKYREADGSPVVVIRYNLGETVHSVEFRVENSVYDDRAIGDPAEIVYRSPDPPPYSLRFLTYGFSALILGNLVLVWIIDMIRWIIQRRETAK